jgi:predicted amidohydrolase YtcJ
VATIPAGKTDLVLHEGAVLGHPGSDSVAIAGGRIAAHGPFSELKTLVGPRTHLLKLSGRTVAPGFIDAHLHFLETAAAASGLAVFRCRTVGELLAELRVTAARTAPGNWLRAFGCDESLLLDKRGPTRAELDHAVPKNPLRLRHQTLHASWLNSRAIATLGLEAPGFAPPDNALMACDAAGKLTGLVIGMEEWITAHLPRVTRAEIEARARVLSRELAASGVTGFIDATVRNGADEAALFGWLAGSGALSARARIMIGAAHLESAEAADRAARQGGVAIVAAKFMPGVAHGEGQLSRRVRQALELGLDCAFHATEVEDLDEALGAFELAKRQMNGSDSLPAFRIEHGGTIPPNFIDRIAAVNAWVVTNPGFIYYRGSKYADDPGLVPHRYRAASLKRAGIHLAAGTDAPVTPPKPLSAIAAAVSRTTVDGRELAPEEALTIEDALALFTRDAARLARLDAGVIQPGALADLIVLPRDPLTLPPAELASLPVDVTIVGGRVIYERGRPAIASSDIADLQTP